MNDNMESVNENPSSSRCTWLETHSVQQLTWLEPNSDKKEWNAEGNDHDSRTCFSQHTEQVAEMTTRGTPPQTDVIFFVKDALVRICEDNLTATRNVTATP